MAYFLAFLEGILTFVSPCMLPMLPVYLSFFAAGGENRLRTLQNALGFILGFTMVFVAMGAVAGSLGGLVARHQTAVNLVTGGIVVLFGLGYLGVFRLPFLTMGRGLSFSEKRLKNLDFLSSVLFGLVFSVSWTPCVWTFLGAALTMAASAGQRMAGIWMLLLFCMGLGIPFLVAALLVERLKTAFDFIKRHYRVINLASGVFLVLVGVSMMAGWMGRLMNALSVWNG